MVRDLLDEERGIAQHQGVWLADVVGDGLEGGAGYQVTPSTVSWGEIYRMVRNILCKNIILYLKGMLTNYMNIMK